MSQHLGGLIPMGSYKRQTFWPGGRKVVERAWSVVWLRRRLTITHTSKD